MCNTMDNEIVRRLRRNKSLGVRGRTPSQLAETMFSETGITVGYGSATGRRLSAALSLSHS